MAGDASYIDYLQELLSGLGTVAARRMFGGHGFYHDGLIFAIVVEQRLYLKVDDETRPAFTAAGCEAWVYEARGKAMATSYWSVPDEAMDSSEAMTPWARRAYAAALRKTNAKPVAKAKRPVVAADVAVARKKTSVVAKATTRKPTAAKTAKPSAGKAKPQP